LQLLRTSQAWTKPADVTKAVKATKQAGLKDANFLISADNSDGLALKAQTVLRKSFKWRLS
jgi:hypothetical protein